MCVVGFVGVATSFNGGINQALDQLRAGKSINVVGILGGFFRSVIFNGFIKLMFLLCNILIDNLVCVLQLLLCCFCCPFVVLLVDL